MFFKVLLIFLYVLCITISCFIDYFIFYSIFIFILLYIIISTNYYFICYLIMIKFEYEIMSTVKVYINDIIL